MSNEIWWTFNKIKIRITKRALLVYMKGLIVGIINKTTCKAYVLVEAKKMAAHQNYMPIGITTDYPPESVQRSNISLFRSE